VIKSVETGRTVNNVSREADISEDNYYAWKAKYGDMKLDAIIKKDLEGGVLKNMIEEYFSCE